MNLDSLIMGKTQKRSKILKFFSCLTSKSEDIEDSKMSPKDSVVRDLESSKELESWRELESVNIKDSENLDNTLLDPTTTMAAIKVYSPTDMLHSDERTPDSSEPPLAQQEDLAEEEQIETSNDSVASSAPVTQQPESSTTQQGALEDEGAEEEVAVEMPPPMQEISTIPLPSNDVAADEKLNPEATDGSGSEQGDRSSLPGTQGEGQEGDDLSDNVTAEGGLSEDENNRQKNLRKRNFVIRELIETERDYVHDLGLIVEGYMHLINTGEVTLPEGMEGKDKIVFGNIHQIYDWHKDIFKKELEKCMDEPERIGYLFIRYEKQMQMYVKYCENKPKSDYIVPEYYDWFEELRQQLGHRLSIPDLLIKPVQRIMKYQLLLKDILKYTDKAGEDTKDLQRGVGVMVVVPKKADDMMNVCRLQGFHGKIHAQGELLLQDTLMVTEVGSKVKSDRSKIKERRVFLFEQIVIVSEEVEKKKNSLSSSSYIFKNSIMSNKMGLHESGNPGDLTFTLNDKAPGSDLKLVMQAPSEQVRQNWVSQIRSILDMQGDFLKALQSPIAYQKELTLTKELSAPDFGNVQGRNSMLRKTQSQPQPPKSGSSSHGQGAVSSTSHTNLSDKDLGGAGGLRCKAVTGDAERKTSCPSSPTSRDPPNEKPRLENKKTAPAAIGASIGLAMSPASVSSGSPKPKRLFEGFRNTLRPKSKSQDNSTANSTNNTGSTGAVGGAACAPGGGGGKSPSPAPPGGATATSPNDPYSSAPSLSESIQEDRADDTNENESIVEGSVVRIVSSYQAIHDDEVNVQQGEEVTILQAKSDRYLIYRAANEQSPAAEGWISSQAFVAKENDNGVRKSWHQAFRLRKPSFGKDRKERAVLKGGSLDRNIKLNKDRHAKILSPEFVYELPPTFQEIVSEVNVMCGDSATLMCKVCGRPKPVVTWQGPDQSVILPSTPGFRLTHEEDGVASLHILRTNLTDAGEYTCIATNEIGSQISSARLTVIADTTGAPGRPNVSSQRGSVVMLEWTPCASPPLQGYNLQFLEDGVSTWQTIAEGLPTTSYQVSELQPGGAYQFRVVAANGLNNQMASRPSNLVIISTEDKECAIWRTSFDWDYTEVLEIARGRFSTVRKCQDNRTRREVAAKFIMKKLVEREKVEKEYLLLSALQHPHLVEVFEVYNSNYSHIIIMDLMLSGRLFDYICNKPHFDELQAAGFIHQLLDVVKYLHNCRVVHLDIKPENLMVDIVNLHPRLKLIDFGDAHRLEGNCQYVHPIVGSPEFCAPELISGQVVTLAADIWSIGVVVYVMLSGVSPFLDESVEESCSNILRNDYSFPEDYFAGISAQARDFIGLLLNSSSEDRPLASACMDHDWIKRSTGVRTSSTHVKPLVTARLGDFIERRKHQNDTTVVSSMKLSLA